MYRVVFDTNIYISGIGFDGKPEKLIRQAHHGIFSLYISPEINLEIGGILQRKLKQTPTQIAESLLMIQLASKLIFPGQRVNIIKSDPTDNKILECVLECDADFLVSGDKKHLLSLNNYKSTKIISAQEFFNIINPSTSY